MLVMSLKRHRGERSLSTDDSSVKRIVRHKEHHDSPPHNSIIDHDGRKRSLSQREYQNSRPFNDGRGSFNKFPKYTSHRNSEERSPPTRERHPAGRHSQFLAPDSPPPPPRHTTKPHHYNDSHGHMNSGSSLLDQIDYSLHISNLDMRVSDEELRKALFKEFKRYGFINIKVLGYGKDRKAFINYHHYDEARKARKETQNLRVYSRSIHVEWSKQTLLKYPEVATGKKSSGTTMNNDTTHNSSYYDNYHGNNEGSRLNDGGGRTTSLSNRNHHERLSLDHDDKRDVSYRSSNTNSSRSGVPLSTMEPKQVIPITDPNATRTLFVGNLELDTTERELRDLFSQYGRIESVDIKLAKSAGTTYAFVKFTTITDAMNAKDDMHGRLYGNTKLKIGFGKGSPTGKVWVGNLKSTRDLAEVRHEMDRFGLVRRCDYRDGDNHAYIHFESLDAAQASVSALDGFRLRNGRSVKLDLHKPLFMRDGEEFSGSELRHDSEEFITTSNHRHHSEREVVTYTSRKSSTDGCYRGKDRVVNDVGDSREKNLRKRHRSPERPLRQISRQRDGYDGDESNSKRRAVDSKHHHQKGYGHHSSDRQKSTKHSDRDTSRKNSEREHTDKDSSRFDDGQERKSEKKTNSAQMKSTSESSIQALSAEASVMTIMMESDSALKLNNSTEPVSPESIGKTNKPDSPQCDSLSELSKLYPSPWRGNLVLKNTGFPARMYLIGGDPSVAESLLRCKDEQNALRITQRLRLEQPRLDEVNKRISLAGPSGHCILFALPGSTANQNSPDNGQTSMQLRPLRSLVSYLKQKEAAGIVALSAADFGEVSENKDPKEVVGVLHAFPPCDFSHSQLSKIIPSLGPDPSKEDHIVVLLVKGNV